MGGGLESRCVGCEFVCKVWMVPCAAPSTPYTIRRLWSDKFLEVKYFKFETVVFLKFPLRRRN